MLTKRRTHSMMHRLAQGVLALVFLLTGCTTLVNDPVRQGSAVEAHCSGTEWADNSSVAVLPIPVVAFFVPHVDIHDIKSDDLLKRCGEPTRLINRKVEVSRVAWNPTRPWWGSRAQRRTWGDPPPAPGKAQPAYFFRPNPRSRKPRRCNCRAPSPTPRLPTCRPAPSRLARTPSRLPAGASP